MIKITTSEFDSDEFLKNAKELALKMAFESSQVAAKAKAMIEEKVKHIIKPCSCPQGITTKIVEENGKRVARAVFCCKEYENACVNI